MPSRARRTEPIRVSAPAPDDDWISMRHVHLMQLRAEAAGYPIGDALRSIGLDPSGLDDPDGRVSLGALEPMFDRVRGEFADLPLGLELARDAGPATFGTLGFIVQSCPRFSDVLESLVRFNGLSSSVGHVSVLHTLDGVHVRWECRAGGPSFRREATDYVLGSFARLLESVVPGGRSYVRGVRLARPRPGRRSRRDRYREFFGVPVRYDADVACVVLDAEVLSVRIPGGDARVKELLERHTSARRGHTLSSPSVADTVRSRIAATMAVDAPTREAIASRLGMSVRSLVRQLSASGTSFREILDAERSATAESLLVTTDDGVDSIAAALGFGSARAFSRWFKAARGTSPGDFRRDSRKVSDERSRP